MRNRKNKIKFLIREASKSFGKELKSVVLFGSACFKKNPRDVDLIFVFEDDVPLGKRRLEIKKIFKKYFPQTDEKFLFIEEKLTIYRPPYLCHEKDFIKRDFRKIFFSTRFPLWSFFFFKSGYMKGLQKNHKVLYGVDYFGYWNDIYVLTSEGFFSFLQEIVEFFFFLFLYLIKKEKSEEYFMALLKKLPLHLFILDRKEYPEGGELFLYIRKEYPWLDNYTKKVKKGFSFLVLIQFFLILFMCIIKAVRLSIK
jgi:predicted nucleotidyltransferase